MKYRDEKEASLMKESEEIHHRFAEREERDSLCKRAETLLQLAIL